MRITVREYHPFYITWGHVTSRESVLLKAVYNPNRGVRIESNETVSVRHLKNYNGACQKSFR